MRFFIPGLRGLPVGLAAADEDLSRDMTSPVRQTPAHDLHNNQTPAPHTQHPTHGAMDMTSPPTLAKTPHPTLDGTPHPTTVHGHHGEDSLLDAHSYSFSYSYEAESAALLSVRRRAAASRPPPARARRRR